MSHVERLIAGLRILATHDPARLVHPCSRVGRSVSAQKEAFGGITDAHRVQLSELSSASQGRPNRGCTFICSVSGPEATLAPSVL